MGISFINLFYILLFCINLLINWFSENLFLIHILLSNNYSRYPLVLNSLNLCFIKRLLNSLFIVYYRGLYVRERSSLSNEHFLSKSSLVLNYFFKLFIYSCYIYLSLSLIISPSKCSFLIVCVRNENSSKWQPLRPENL